MDQTKKITLVAVVAVFMFIVLLAFGLLMADEADPATSEPEAVGVQLWEMRPLELLILSVVMFGGVLGILTMVGGEFKWS